MASEVAADPRAILEATTAVEKSNSRSAIVVPATLPPGDTIAATGAANTGASTHRGETPCDLSVAKEDRAARPTRRRVTRCPSTNKPASHLGLALTAAKER